MLQHQLNMFEHEILDAKNTRGDNYVIIMEKIKEKSGKEKDTVIQTPKVLGILVEDRVATRIYRNNKKYGRKAKGYGRSRHSSRGGRGKQPQLLPFDNRQHQRSVTLVVSESDAHYAP